MALKVSLCQVWPGCRIIGLCRCGFGLLGAVRAPAEGQGTRGDIERHCGTSIGKIDGWVAGPLALDGEPGNQPEWRL
jgi:hypothetical protein